MPHSKLNLPWSGDAIRMLMPWREVSKTITYSIVIHIVTHNWVERGTVRVKCRTQKDNTMSSARARTRGLFLESPGNVSGPESHSKISNTRITELFCSRILNMNSGSLHTRSFRCIHLSAFRRRWSKNLLTDPKRGFRETGPRTPGPRTVGSGDERTDHGTTAPPTILKMMLFSVPIALLRGWYRH